MIGFSQKLYFYKDICKNNYFVHGQEVFLFNFKIWYTKIIYIFRHSTIRQQFSCPILFHYGYNITYITLIFYRFKWIVESKSHTYRWKNFQSFLLNHRVPETFLYNNTPKRLHSSINPNGMPESRISVHRQITAARACQLFSTMAAADARAFTPIELSIRLSCSPDAIINRNFFYRKS